MATRDLTRDGTAVTKRSGVYTLRNEADERRCYKKAGIFPVRINAAASKAKPATTTLQFHYTLVRFFPPPFGMLDAETRKGVIS